MNNIQYVLYNIYTEVTQCNVYVNNEGMSRVIMMVAFYCRYCSGHQYYNDVINTSTFLFQHNIKLGNNFLPIPKLPANRKGFVIWKERLELSICACGLYGHLDGTVTRLDNPSTRPKGSTLTVEEVSSNAQYVKDLNQYLQVEAVVFQQIALTIPNSLHLKMKGKPTVKEAAWDTLKADFKKQSHMIMVNLQKCLYDIHCINNENIQTHFDNICMM